MAVAAIGLVLGVMFGSINLFYVLEVVRRDIAGMRLEYQLPLATVATLIPVMLGAGFLAAVWPARSAGRGSLVEALEYE